MHYSEFVEVYEKLNKTPSRLGKTTIIAEFLKKLRKEGKSEWIYLLRGRVFPDYDPREFGISRQLSIKALSVAFGIKSEEIVKKFNKVGDLGEIAQELRQKKRQTALFSKRLSVEHVFNSLRKLVSVEGKGAIERKLQIVSELLSSASDGEAKYIMRTLVNDLRVGVAESTIVDAIAEAFFPDKKGEMADKIEAAYDLANDFAIVFEKAVKGEKALDDISITPERPMNVMLAVKVETIEEGFEVCGKPAALEYKYDGFRLLLNKKGKEIFLFTRRLENVTKQFPDVVEAVKKNVSGESFILDAEVVGYNPKTKKYKPFEAVSQRIKRKYDIDKLMKEIPVEVNVFDVVYYNGKSLINEKFLDRRKIVEKIVKKDEWKIKPAVQLVTSSEKEAEEFYRKALKVGEEGIMMKNIGAPYKQGRRVGYMAKLKPVVKELDLVIVGAEYGSGKRGGWLTSYIVACKDNGNFLEVGKVSSGLKEKEEEGTSYDEMTKLLKPLITEDKGDYVIVSSKVIVSVTYQNIQPSPSYSSGYALRFPRITHYRPDRRTDDIATLNDIKRAVGKQR